MTSYHGKWILTPDQRLIENAYLVCIGSTIRQVTRNRPDGEVIDHDGLILPGLVNAHTHLEFSDLTEPLGESGSDFVSWIGQVIKHRNQRDSRSLQQIIQLGLSESAENGTCAIGEISTFDWFREQQPEIDIIDFRELLGFRMDQHEPIARMANDHVSHIVNQDASNNLNWRAGLSPHAPYSINRESLEFSVDVSSRRKIPLAMHLAETREELELLSAHRGPFFELLNRLELWTPNNFALNTTPKDFLSRLARSFRTLVIHGNYLTDLEMSLIAANRQVLRLVFCPRTHAFFQHDPYPLDLVSKHGIELALGTDSRASNPDLSIWNEMKFLYQNHSLAPREIVQMGTQHGATALGLEKKLGTLSPGKLARVFLAPPPHDCEFTKAIVNDRR